MRKMIWLDTETGGVDSARHALLQIAVIIDVEGQPLAEYRWNVHPLPGTHVSKESLGITGLTVEQIKEFQPAALVKQEFEAVLSHYVDKYNKADKFIVGGYMAQFDTDFLRQWFLAQGDKYYGSWFSPYYLDVAAFAYTLRALGLFGLDTLEKMKLVCVCEHFGIPIEQAHDALADIRATRSLFQHLLKLCFTVTEDGRVRRSDELAAATGKS